MRLILFFYFDKIKYAFIIFAFLFLVFNIWFPYEAFAMTPTEDIIEDYYGDKEYIGKDAYAHFNESRPNNFDTIFPIANIKDETNINNFGIDSYGTSPPHEKDWYEHNVPPFGKQTEIPSKNISVLTILKRRIFWYSWKIYSKEYMSYEDFKAKWDTNSSIRKEIKRDLKEVFKRKSS